MQATDTIIDPIVIAANELAARMGVEYLTALAIVQATAANAA